ncbi:LptF/LptG family permease [Wenzhouxiangella sp. XN79A]|uniref:LptF/LptG family permease n=1 Tax=Wenzhouxiangella sp. XN79A TaxID=2724193 RepID=UPI00144AE5C8|nr:LptF/LptG family permease [Wenzhouxiangella sp. XN79A]NKI36006.1 LptF/LptG family permease [Wenzhouxiangella sp. XN79A]
MSVLDRYLLGRLLRGYLGMGLAVGALVWLIALLEALGADNGGGALATLWQASAAVPIRLIDLLPVVTVLATASVLAALQAQRELVVVRAAGMSLLHVTRLALVPALGAALLALAALQFLAPTLSPATGDRVEAGAPGDTSLWHPWHGLWVRSNADFMNVRRFDPGQLPGDIAIYEFDDQGRLERQIRAERAVPAPERWTLEEVQIKTLDGSEGPRIVRHEQYRWDSFLTARQLELFRQPPASLPLTDLWTYVASLEERAQDASEFELVLWRRITLPLAGLGMVLIAAALAASPGKGRGFSLKLVASVGVGLGYHLLAGMAGFFALVTDLPPAPVVLVPPLLLVVGASVLLVRSR